MSAAGDLPAADGLMAAVTAAFPDLSGRPCRILGEGFDSVALEVDDRLVFKFPRHETARQALLREASLLAVIRPRVTLPVPDLAIVDGGVLFSRHVKIPGEHLHSLEYRRLDPLARERLARDLALFYVEMHSFDREEMRMAGAGPMKPWLPADKIFAGLRRFLLDEKALSWSIRTFQSWLDLPSDPLGSVYGHFDTHGRNLAFNYENGVLAGIYDFADSGFGPAHQDFIYPSWISFELTTRIVDLYNILTGQLVDLSRVRLTWHALLIAEFVEFSNESGMAPLDRMAELRSLACSSPPS